MELPCGHENGTKVKRVIPEDPNEPPFCRSTCVVCGRWVGDTPTRFELDTIPPKAEEAQES